MVQDAEIVVIGAGIAGASLAYRLVQAGCRDLVILEREETTGVHASGRSAAVLSCLDVDELFMNLAVRSIPFFRSPPDGFSEVPILHRNGILLVGRGPGFRFMSLYARLARRLGVASERWTPEEAAERVPALDKELIDGGIYLPEGGLLDVHALLWGYLQGARRGGARLETSTEVTGIRVEGRRVRAVVTPRGEIACRRVVNAAGAWANPVALLAGAAPLPVVPYRRHIIVTAPPDSLPLGDWPLTADITRHFYFRPESGGILASPMDEEPMEPCDARPDELQVARTADLLARFTPRITPRRILNKWAGLRTVAVDHAPVVGEDPSVEGLFWLAGQGGHGMETSPLLSSIAADLLLEGTTDRLPPALISPGRFRRGRLSLPAILARRVLFFLEWMAGRWRSP